MAKLPQGYLDKVEALERKFEVISVIFKKYESEFCEVFVLQEKKQTTGPSVGRPRSRKPSRLVSDALCKGNQYRQVLSSACRSYSI